jgi:serine/threonine protein phosphatase 1
VKDTVYYAIGDIHGEIDKLLRLYEMIAEDAEAHGAATMLIHLGDMIDRGPDSRGVVDLAMTLEQATDCVSLKGNHEELMLYAYDRPDTAGIFHWASNGGDETIASYRAANGDVDDWREAIDQRHLDWLRARPVEYRDEERKLLFVHAGIDPRRYPNCPEEVKLWTRSPVFFNPKRWPKRPELDGLIVVHGHTPTEDFEPDLKLNRINVDTGACFGGPLTAVVLAPGEAPRFLQSGKLRPAPPLSAKPPRRKRVRSASRAASDNSSK